MRRGSPNRNHGEAYEILGFLNTTKVNNATIVGTVRKEQQIPHTQTQQQQQKESKQAWK